MPNGLMNGAMNRKALILVGPVAGIVVFISVVWIASAFVRHNEYKEPYRAPAASTDATPRAQGVTAEFNRNSILELTPDLIGPTEIRNQGIIGESVNLTVEHLDEILDSYDGIVRGNMAGGFSKFNRPFLVVRNPNYRARLGPIDVGYRASTADVPYGYLIQTYYKGPLENPSFNHMPVPCMHCEHAPCELVCPVAATVHDHEGRRGRTRSVLLPPPERVPRSPGRGRDPRPPERANPRPAPDRRRLRAAALRR